MDSDYEGIDRHIEQYMQKNKLELAGHVYTDIASLLIIDPSKILSEIEYEEYMKKSSSRKGKPYMEFFGGLVSDTGYGDNNYPVFIRKNDEGRVMELRIRFDVGYGVTDVESRKMRYIAMCDLYDAVVDRERERDPDV